MITDLELTGWLIEDHERKGRLTWLVAGDKVMVTNPESGQQKV